MLIKKLEGTVLDIFKTNLSTVLIDLYNERYGEDLTDKKDLGIFLNQYQESFFVDVFENEEKYAYYIAGLDEEVDGYNPEVVKETFNETTKEAIHRLAMFFYESKCSSVKKPIDSQEYLHKSKSGKFYLITCASEKTLDDLIYEVRQFHNLNLKENV